MIGFEQCTKHYVLDDEERVILREATLLFEPWDRICILAPPGVGKTTIAHLLAGFTRPTEGNVHRSGRISWPLGFTGALHPSMTGERNVEIIADLAEAPRNRVSAYVAEFSELGEDYHRKVETYSSSMRARLGFALSMAIPADTYVADGNIGTGAPSFRTRCEVALEQKLNEGAGLFFLTHSPRLAERFGRRFAVLQGGKFVLTADAEEAKGIFETQLVEQDSLQQLVEGFSSE
ncbi:ATP-binding cassette domain-containing protein [Alteraurantiacibacter aquimixticola]|uniref:ATP-binding cassette domain-containing protein n=1 Tax=Alteraurantiacibacter aquimixticola TaxID=2489173 RepID=A0A4T3F320_9SPHN|nr:ATP-binding cassette domain-containing protein [Alteraurantiacibacter aquimixticola]TIX50705.1 ATP-binding cassette domain-containing protein [Alteraurantiacibacter aquimixticola]